MERLSTAKARGIALAAQMWPGAARKAKVNTGSILRLVDRLNLLQIDSVNVLARAHLMPLFSRLGPYDVGLIDRASGGLWRCIQKGGERPESTGRRAYAPSMVNEA